MILLFGTKPYHEELKTLTLACDYCGATAGQRLAKTSNKFTLFFVLPMFNLSSHYSMQCLNCGAETYLDKPEAERLLASNLGEGLR